jgi:hypothetical protein
VSTFRRRLAITVDEERLEVRTTVGDHLRAEEAAAREHREVGGAAVLLQTRVAFYALGRTYPEHALARNWVKFTELFDDIDDLEAEEETNPMDPTRQADWEDSL